MKVKRMGITDILRRIWLFSANKIKNKLEKVFELYALVGILGISKLFL